MNIKIGSPNSNETPTYIKMIIALSLYGCENGSSVSVPFALPYVVIIE